MNGTYTQRRRMQMAGGGITNARQGFFLGGIGDFFGGIKDKIVDDLIPNEIKESPIGAALVGGALVNEFGLIPGMGGDVGDFGKNWLGNLLGGQFGLPKDLNLVLGDDIGFTGGITPGDFDFEDARAAAARGATSLEELSPIRKALATILPGGDPGYVEGGLYNQLLGLNQPQQYDSQGRPIRSINWQTPLAVGLAAGAAQKAMSEGDVLPQDTTGLDLPAIRAAALAGPEAARAAGLYFTPTAEATTAYADGGRIGYAGGGGHFESYKDYLEQLPNNDKILELYAAGDMAAVIRELKRRGIDTDDQYAQGGRIGAQEGGLMNLGGMEKDYRNEGGFVPIGAEEKADDVPARLSKNEFVFTADAVRAAGGGDIDKGAEVMENLMDNLEGAQAMFANTQRLQNRII